MNFSTTTPYRPITIRARSKYWDSSSRTTSGSRDSDNGVNPTKSANNTDTNRRSATGASRAGDGDSAARAGAAAAGVSADPQEPQNRLPGGFDVPHAAQTAASGLPQPPQKRFSGGFSMPQLVQVAMLEA